MDLDSDKKSRGTKLIIGFYGHWVILTYIGVISAILGINFAIQGNIRYAIICLMVSGLCDMFDGPVARLKKRMDREENFGIQIDSLADIVCFGILPAIIGFAITSDHAGHINGSFGMMANVAVYSIYVLAALIRLGYFNVIEIELNSRNEKRKYYEGLPVTSVALIIPVVYAVCYYFSFSLSVVYNKLLILLAIAFLLKVRIPKPKTRFLIVFCLIGVPILVLIYLSRGA